MDLMNLNTRDYAEMFAKAVRLGITDATNELPAKSGADVIRALQITHFRNGHKKYLKTAYTAGRFQVETMGLD